MAVTGGTGITEARPDIAASISASLSTVSASPASVATGVNSTVTITVKDVDGNPVPGVSVTLSATGSGNTIVQPGPTNASGVTTGTISSTLPAVKVVLATAGGTPITQTATVTVVVGAVSAAQSTVVAAPSSIEAGSALSTITVTVKDAYGNPISGATVVLASTGTGNTLTQPGSVTDASGIATGTLSSTVVESKTVSATAAGTAITQTAAVTVTLPTLPASGLVLQLQADAIVGLVDGDPVGTWADSSGNGHPVTQATAAKKPLYKVNVQNGKPAVRFDGVDDAMATGAFTLNQPHTRFVAFVQRQASPGATVLDGTSGDNTARLGSNIVAGTNTGQAYAGAPGINSGVALTVGSAFVLGAVFNGASSVIRVNGTEVTGNAGAGNPGGLRIAESSSQLAQVDVLEVVQYDRALSASERTQVAAYLQAKYGIA